MTINCESTWPGLTAIELALTNHMRSISHHWLLIALGADTHMHAHTHAHAHTHTHTHIHTHTHTHTHTYTHTSIPMSRTKAILKHQTCADLRSQYAWLKSCIPIDTPQDNLFM